jgi:hypothetical protein
MKILGDICQKLTTDLEQIAMDIEALTGDLASFEEYTSEYPAMWIALRLQAVHVEIGIEVLERYLQHHGQGSVCVMSSHQGTIAVVWFKEKMEPSAAGKSWTNAVTTLPPAEFFTFIDQLQQRLHKGDWEPVVNWLKTNAIRVVTGDLL